MKFFKLELEFNNITNQLFFIILSLMFTYLVWDLINFSFKNPHDIISPLTIKEINPTNQIIRFFLSPVLCFFLIFFYFIFKKKINFFDLINQISNNFTSYENTKNLTSKYYIFLFLVFISNITYFIGYKFFPLREIDFLHHGEHLTSAYNYYLTKKIWLGTYMNHGAGMDMFWPYLSWKIFGNISVGSYELGKIILFKIFLPFAFYIYIFQISVVFLKNNDSRILFISSFIFLYYLIFRHYFAQLDFREIFVFIPIFFLFEFYIKKKIIYLIPCYLFSSISYFWSLDTGLIVNIILLFNLIILFFFIKEKNVLIAAILALITSWIIFITFAGLKEFNKFLENTIHLYQTGIFFQGRVIEKIFTNTLTTTPIIFLTLLSAYTAKKIVFANKNSFILINMWAVTNLYFISPMSTYASGHVKHASVFLLIHCYLIIFKKIDYYLNKENFEKIKEKLSLLSIALLIIFNLTYPFYNKNIFTIQNRLNKFIKMDEYSFFEKFKRYDAIEALKFYKKISKNHNCIMVLNNDTIWPFLLRKKSCSEFFLLFNASSKQNRLKLLHDIKVKKPEIIMISTPERWNIIRGVENEKRHPEVFKHVYNNYHLIKEINNWKFYKKN